MFSGAVAPVAAVIKILGFLVGIEVPWVNFQFWDYEPHPLAALPLSLVIGGLPFLAGKGRRWGSGEVMPSRQI